MHKDDIPNVFHPASVEVSERRPLASEKSGQAGSVLLRQLALALASS